MTKMNVELLGRKTIDGYNLSYCRDYCGDGTDTGTCSYYDSITLSPINSDSRLYIECDFERHVGAPWIPHTGGATNQECFDNVTTPLRLVFQTTPDEFITYEVDYYLNNEDEIRSSAQIKLFDWFWRRPTNPFRKVLERIAADDTDAIVGMILESPDITFISKETGKCLKQRVIDIWEYDYYLDTLESTPENRLLTLMADGYILTDTILINGYEFTDHWQHICCPAHANSRKTSS